MALDNVPPHAVVVDTAAGGDNVIVAGVPGQVIRVYELFLMLYGDTQLTFKDGPATPFDGPLLMFTGGSITFDEPRPPRHWFKTSVGNDFIINLTPGVRLTGRVYYTQSAE